MIHESLITKKLFLATAALSFILSMSGWIRAMPGVIDLTIENSGNVFVDDFSNAAQEVAVTSYTSVQSGLWNSPATWGAAGFPGCSDDVTIANGHTVKLDDDRCVNNFTINSGGTFDLGGKVMSFSGHPVTFTNNGLFTNTGVSGKMISANGGAAQTLAGNGTYNGNVLLENFSVNWTIAAGTTFTFTGATNSVNIQIDHPASMIVTNALTIIGPSTGTNYVIVENLSGAGPTGAGGIRTQGNVRIRGNTAINAPVEIVSGAAQADGTFIGGPTGGLAVDAGASLTLTGAVTVSNISGGSGLILGSAASLDLAGNQVNLVWNSPFTNNGTVNNTGAFSRIVFTDNGSHPVSGTGTYSGNAGLQIFSGSTNIAAGSSLTFGAPAGNTNIQVDSGGALHFTGIGGNLTLSGTVLNNGVINFNSGSTGCGAAIKIRSSVNGTQRPWNGNAMSMTGVDAKDQTGTASVNVTNGLNSGNNGANWTFATPCIRSRADFDGDGKTDLSVFRSSEGNWYLNRSAAGFVVIKWGISSDTLAPGDFDGDGKTDTAIFRPDLVPAFADYYILNSSNFTVSGVSWGVPGDIPVNGDYDADGKADAAVFRPSNSTWYILNSSNGSNTIEPFGLSGDIPLAIDHDGDGKTNLAVFRPGNLTWYIARSTGVPAQSFDAVPFGLAGDKLVPADYDGDGKEDIAVFRPSSGTWYVRRSSSGVTDLIPFGISTDVPVPGDYDGDSKDDVAIYRGGTWYVNRSTSGLLISNFGIASDSPVPAAYTP